MNEHLGVVGAIAFLLLTAGSVVAFSPPLEVVHTHSAHEGAIVDVEYDQRFDVTWSLDEGGTFVGYAVGEAAVEVTHDFEQGHAIAVGDAAVYVAAGDTLWSYDVPAGEINEVGTLAVHPQDMAYDADRGAVWIGGQGTVHGYDVADGTEIGNYSVHSDGVGVVDARGDYVVSGTTWEPEVVVYDVEAGEVVAEPTLPADTQGVSAAALVGDDTLLVGALGDDANDFVGAYDLAADRWRFSHREHVFGVTGLAREPISDLVVSTGGDNTVKFYDPESDSIVEEYVHEDTIYAASLDDANGLVWLGDGQERDGVVSGLDIRAEPAGGETADEETAGEETVHEGDGSGATATAGGVEETPGGDGPGFGVAAALLALAVGAALARRR